MPNKKHLKTHAQIRNEILHRLIDCNMSQGELAKKAKLSPTTICQITSYNEPADPRISTLTTVANAMNCDIEIKFIPRGQMPTPHFQRQKVG